MNINHTCSSLVFCYPILISLSDLRSAIYTNSIQSDLFRHYSGTIYRIKVVLMYQVPVLCFKERVGSCMFSS